MRLLLGKLRISAIASLLWCSFAIGQTATVVQSNSAFATSGTNPTVSFPNNNTAENLLWVAVGSDATITTPTDTLGNTYTLAISVTGSGGSGNAAIYYVASAKAGSNTVTCNHSGNGDTHCHIAEINGLVSSSPLDQTGSVASSSTCSVSTSGATSQANEWIGAFAYDSPSSNALTPGTSYSQIQLSRNTSAGDAALSESENVGLTGVQTATCGGNSSNVLSQLITTFKASGNGSGPFISSLSPTSGPPGTTVTISGSDFGSTQGSSTVSFNGTTGSPTSWGNTSIVVPVPTGATTGNVVVTVGGNASNGVAFTVAAPNVVQSKSGFASGTTNPSVAFSNSNTAGNLLWVAVGSDATISTPSDSQGNTYSLAASVTGSGGSGNAAIYYVPSAKGGANTVTCNRSGSGDTHCHIAEISGLVTSSPLDATGSVASSSTCSVSTSAATTQANEWVSAFFYDSPNSRTLTAGTGYTKLQLTNNTSGGDAAISEGESVTSAAVQTATCGGNSSDVLSQLIATFKAAPGISSISPGSGGVGTSVTITGTSFGSSQGSSTVRFNGTAASPTSWSATSITVPVPSGATTGNVVVTVGGAASNGASFTVISGILAGSLSETVTAVTLTSPVAIDWEYWGFSANQPLVHKAGITPVLTNFTVIGSNAAQEFANGEIEYIWTDGTPVANAERVINGVSIAGVGNGFQLSVPADMTVKTLVLYVGAENAQAQLTASLSDGSAATFTDSSIDTLSCSIRPAACSSGIFFSRTYSIDFRSSQPGQTLNVNYTMLRDESSSGNGSGLKAAVTLSAAVLNPHLPVVTLTAPSDGLVVSYPSNVNIAANASQFDKPISKVDFFSDGRNISEQTSAPYSFVLGGAAAGDHTLSASGTDSAGLVGASSPVLISEVQGGGSLTASINAAADVDLSVGTSDWIHWGNPDATDELDRKAGITPQITDFTNLDNGDFQLVDDTGLSATYSWSGGTPTDSQQGTGTQLLMQGFGNGFTLTIPANTTVRSANLYLGYGLGSFKLRASLSDGSATPWTNVFSASAFDFYEERIVNFQYQAASAGQELILTGEVTDDQGFGYVDLESASVSDQSPPTITYVNPTSVAAGMTITIEGANFGNTAGTVALSGNPLNINSWSNETITATLSGNYSSGPLVVSHGLVNSNSVPITFTSTVPVINSVTPAAGQRGTAINITGSGFGASQGAGTVLFNGAALGGSVQSWSDSQIVALVPTIAATGSLAVQTNAPLTSNAVAFIVLPGTITGISPTSGPANSIVTVSGSGFGIAQGTAVIQFNGTTATPFSWSDSTITVPVPAGATTGPVLITDGGSNSNNVAFTVTPGPSISSLSVSSGAPGTTVTISGQNFGATQGSSVVRFNGLPAAVTSWAGNSIGVTVPGGVTTGPVTVTVSGQVSNGVTFTAITAGTLSGTVSSSAGGSVISGASVQILQNGTVKGSATTTSNGAYSIANLPAGSYDVQASAGGFGSALINSVAVSGGQTATANFSLSAPGTISGTVTKSDGVTAIAGANVQYFVGSAAGAATTTNSSGSYSLTGLNAGSYTVEAGANGYVTQSQTASVTGGNGSTANFSLQALGAKPIQYVYDELGRLVAVIDSSGDTATYQYDAVGNILSISRQNSSQLGIISFTPRSGTAGTSVTINGTGFSPTASQDGVAFNGVSATVTSATATQIVATVPAAATTGPITVTIPSGSVSSATNFTIPTNSGAPTISGFTPTTGTPGTGVIINGTNFDSLFNDVVVFNTTLAHVNSTSATQINASVPANAGSGHITVITPAGQATSTQDFYVPFGTHAVGDIGYASRISPGSTQTFSLAAGKIGLLIFDGIAGQGVSLQFSGSTFTTCNLYLYTPNLSQVASTFCNGSTGFIGSTRLPANGTYTIGIDPGGSAGSISIGLTPDVTGSITPGTPLNVTTSAAGQGARYTFSGVAGQRASVSLTNSTYRSCVVSILKADGTTLGSAALASSSSGFVDSVTLPTSGTYTVLVTSQFTGSLTALLNVFMDISGTITEGGPAVTVTTTVPGQDARLTFSGTAGQRVSLALTNITNPEATVILVKPDGTNQASVPANSQPNSAFMDRQTLATSGTYTLWVQHFSQGTGSETLQLYNVPQDVTGTITPGGATVTVTTTVAGQDASLTFSGTSGQRISLLISNITYACTVQSPGVNFSVINPDSTTLFSGNICATSGYFDVTSLAQNGTYTLVVDPQGPNPGSATLQLNLVPADVTGTITIGGSAVTITTTVAGQNASLTFTGVANQVISLQVSNITYACTVLSPGVNFKVINPDSSTLFSGNICGTSGSFTGKTLPASGTYTLIVDPQGPNTGSTTLTLTSP